MCPFRKALVLAAALLGGTPAVQGAYELHIVLQKGDPYAGSTIMTFDSSPMINDLGEVATAVVLANGLNAVISQTRGVVALQNTTTVAGHVVGSIAGDASINNAGQICFLSGANIFIVPTDVIPTGSAVAGKTILNFHNRPPAINSSGQVAFGAVIRNAGTNELHLFTRTADIAGPGTVIGGRTLTLLSPLLFDINDAGVVAFTSQFISAGTPYTGIYTPGGPVIESGMTYEGLTPTNVFQPSINGSGHVACRATYHDATHTYPGIFIDHTLVASGSPAGMVGPYRLLGLNSDPTLSDSGEVAFWSGYQGGPTGSGHGLFTQAGLVASSHDVVDGLQISSFHFRPSINASGDIAVFVWTTNAPGYAILLAHKIPEPPPPDPHEANDTVETAALLTPQWTHVPFSSLTIFDPQALVPDGVTEWREETKWTATISDLSLHTSTDKDFFRVQLPDPGSPAFDGYPDIHPGIIDVEPLPECGTLHRRGIPWSTLDTLEVSGAIRLSAHGGPAGEKLVVLGASSGGADDLHRFLDCPRSALGSDELRFSYGDLPAPRAAIGGYQIELEYVVTVVRHYEMRTRIPVPREMPCGSGVVPNCTPDFGGRIQITLQHPYDAPLEDCGNYCADALLISWPGGDLDIVITCSASDLDAEIDLSDGSLVIDSSPESLAGGGEVETRRRIQAPQLPAGDYILFVTGPPMSYVLDVQVPGSAPRFIRGDCNGDGRVQGEVTDAIFLLAWAFLGGQKPPCLAACDVDGNGAAAEVTDAINLLVFNFQGGSAPPAPFPECGPGAPGGPSCEAPAADCR